MSSRLAPNRSPRRGAATAPLSVRALLRLDSLLDDALDLALGVADGVRLGLLSDRTLTAVDDAYYQREAKYVDAGYNQQGLWLWEREAVRSHFLGCRRVAVTSAGGGREVLALRAMGIDALGFEPNEGLVEFGNALAERLGHGRPLAVVGRSAFPDVHDIDGLIVGWGGYMLMRGREQRVQFLRSAAAALPPSAPILLSYFTRRGDRLRFRAGRRIGNVARIVRAGRPIELGDAMSPNYVHHFTAAEALREVRDGGFEPLACGNDGYGWVVARRAVDGRAGS